ncbi:MAG TPA: c-type cytochrome [Steroidobacteraceae bacterium]|nr:c-type cytochrome [Steroidobacteraceae bacterium]
MALTLALVAGGLLCTAAQADEAMAAKYGCVSCHELDFKKVGPAYEAVAKKYHGADAATIETLVKHVREGSTGVWGKDIMPPQTLVPEKDVRELVSWVLSLDSSGK